MAETNFNLKFKYGNEERLYQKETNGAFTLPIENGAIYVTTDKHSIFCDLNNERFRIGDYVRKYSNLEELRQDAPSWYQNSLVFIETGSILAIYDESKNQWIQINDTSALSSALNQRIDGLEGRIKTIEDLKISETYATKAELEAEKSERTNADTGFNTRIEALENKTDGFENTTIKKYVDDQIGSINNSETGILAQAKKYTDDEILEATGAINNTITGLEADIEAIDGKINQETQNRKDAISKEVTDRNAAITSAISKEVTDRDSAIASAISKEVTDRDSAIAAANTALAGQISGQITELDTKINQETQARENAISTLRTGTIEPLATKVSNLENVTSGFTGVGAISTAISTAQESAEDHADALVEALTKDAQTINTFKKVENEFALVRSEVNTQMQTADAMTFKGVLSATTETNSITYLVLPTTGVQKGDTYKISENGAIIDADDLINENDSITVRVGDLIIAGADQGDQEETYSGKWYHISSGYEDDYNAYFIGSDNNNRLELKGGAGEDKGSITFVSDNIHISMISSTNETGVNNSELAFSLVWGTF